MSYPGYYIILTIAIVVAKMAETSGAAATRADPASLDADSRAAIARIEAMGGRITLTAATPAGLPLRSTCLTQTQVTVPLRT